MSADDDDATALLIRARSYIERGWCRHALALDMNGNRVHPITRQAVMWCMNGALLAVRLTRWSHPAVYRLEDAIDGEDIADFNDAQETVEPILAAFDRAIAAEPT